MRKFDVNANGINSIARTMKTIINHNCKFCGHCSSWGRTGQLTQPLDFNVWNARQHSNDDHNEASEDRAVSVGRHIVTETLRLR